MIVGEFTEILAVTTTVGKMDDALRLARAIVQKELAACVQVDTIAASIHRWEGAVCEEPEVRLTIKALPVMDKDLVEFLRQEHPYDLPQITSTLMRCTPEYGSWVASNAGVDF